ncbi:MAG TPA: hypothetical protein VMB35_06910 [Methanomicrobiales archaeon]|nr:hypothetical protein [Methanomicrobiales archaeon]
MTEKGKGNETASTVPAIDLPNQDHWSEVASMADTGSVALAGGRVPASLNRCRRCGDIFPLLDFYYTQKTGLCIPCWEENAI